jgi:hypothetical protein
MGDVRAPLGARRPGGDLQKFLSEHTGVGVQRGLSTEMRVQHA